MQHIYLLKNKKTDRIYVGRTSNVERRIHQHMSLLKSGKHTNELMKQDYELYGEDSFECEVVCSSENFVRSGIEGQYMMKFKTYDKRYGYNYKDPYVWLRQGRPSRHVASILESNLHERRYL